MRVLSVVIALFLLAGIATAQAPSAEPSATLAQLMRAILFPNSNILFDVQSRDPDTPPEEQGGGTVSATFANIYTGWPVVEHAALALAEASNLMMIEGRMCENGKPVPLAMDDWAGLAAGLEDAGRRAAEVARTRDLDAMIEITNDIAGACENCHVVYRRYPEENRCTKP
jgi:hypothetical protein